MGMNFYVLETESLTNKYNTILEYGLAWYSESIKR